MDIINSKKLHVIITSGSKKSKESLWEATTDHKFYLV